MSDWKELEDPNYHCSEYNGWCGWCGNCQQHAEDLREEHSWGDDE